MTPATPTPADAAVNEFLQTALSFPTAVPGVLLFVSVVYWMLAATGLTEGDGAEGLLGGDAASGAAGMLARVGLDGVPLPVAVTVFSFSAWFGTYFLHLLALPLVPETIRGPAGLVALLSMVLVATAATSLVLRPLRRALVKMQPATDTASLLGRTGVVVTPAPAGEPGRASVDDGGAGLVLQIRASDSHPLRRGDRIVLIEYLDGQNAYRVVPEQQFLGR